MYCLTNLLFFYIPLLYYYINLRSSIIFCLFSGDIYLSLYIYLCISIYLYLFELILCSLLSLLRTLWYEQCVTVHHVPKCISCHKAIVVITGRAHCFHDNIYITLILLLWDLSTLCRGSLLTTIYISTLCGFIWKCQSTVFSTKRHFFI